jgi:hypothetical protein
MPSVSELCFSVAPELVEALPTFESAFSEAAARWGWTVRYSDECTSTLGYGEVPQVESESGSWLWPYARAKWSAGGPSRVGGTGSLIVSSHWVEQAGQLKDEPLEGCSPNTVLLRPMLTHELGHLFGFVHVEGGAMGPTLGDCEELWPSEYELSLVAQPG